MGTPQPEHNHSQPAGNKPWGQETVRIYRYRGAMKTFPPPLMAPKGQEQSADHGIDAVLEVGNQLARQYGKGPLLLITQKAGNRDALFPELGVQVNGISPVRRHLTVAPLPATDRTGRAKESEKVNLTGKKRFLVFPNALVCVRVGKLDFSAPCPQGSRLWAAQTFGSASLWGLVILRRSIVNLVISPALIPPVALPCKYNTPYSQLYWGR